MKKAPYLELCCLYEYLLFIGHHSGRHFLLSFYFKWKHFVLIDYILWEIICLFCFFVLFSNINPKIKFTAKSWSDLCNFCSRVILFFIFIPCHTIVAGYYGFTLDVHVFVSQSVSRTSVRLSIFHFWMITWVNIDGFSPNLVCALILWRSGLGWLMGEFCQIFTELRAHDTIMAWYYSLMFLLPKKIYFTWLCWTWLLMSHNNILKISEKLNHQNLLKICLQVTFPTNFCIICIHFFFLVFFTTGKNQNI